MFAPLITFAVILLTLTSILLFMNEEWRFSLILLTLQYLGVLILVSIQWPLSMAVVKLVAGWIAGTVLGIAMFSASVPASENQISQNEDTITSKPTTSPVGVGRPFFILAALLVFLVVISQVGNVYQWIPGIEYSQAWASILLIGMGLLKLGFTTDPFPATLGLLTAVSGFEIAYSVVEPSALVAGLLAVITLSLALVGGYLIIAPLMETDE